MLGGLLLAGAGPRALLPLPPPLPADPPADQAAPVPDADVLAPGAFAPDPSSAVWALRIYRMQEFGTGEGYIPGSAYQSPEQRKPLQTPGFIVTVPLQ
jgi:hypothetical protein